MKTAVITGITGQDGSYLSEYLLGLNYVVYGIVRRSSSFNTQRINHLMDDSLYSSGGVADWCKPFGKNLFLIFGDLLDTSSLFRIIKEVRPNELYNLGAQSHVRVSFDQPEITFNINALGTIKLLEAIRDSKEPIKFYQASSSEMWGNIPAPQNEKTPFCPCSPYGISKLAAYWQVHNYRKNGMFACNGILYNHETVPSFTPMVYKLGKKGEVDIAPISDICKQSGFCVDKTKKQYQSNEINSSLYVWDKNGWTKVKYASAYPRCVKKMKHPVMVNARNAVYSATQDHVVVMSDGEEKKIQNIQIGDKIYLSGYPNNIDTNDISHEGARLLGALVGDGCFSHGLKFTSSDQNARQDIIDLWGKIGDGKWSYNPSTSGFTGKEVGQIILRGSGLSWFKKFDIYTEERDVFGKRYKRVPKQILNSNVNTMRAFLDGYNLADGLKKNRCQYRFKNFKTNSPTLASGLLLLIHAVTKQLYNITVEQSKRWGKTQYYYSINLLSDSKLGQNQNRSIEKYVKVLELIASGCSQRSIQRETNISRGFIRKIQGGYIPKGIHWKTRSKDEVKKILSMDENQRTGFQEEANNQDVHPCCSKTNPMIMLLRQENRIQYVTFWRLFFQD